MAELASYEFYRGRLKSMIRENNKRILPSKWRSELNELQDQCSAIRGPLMDTTWKLAIMDVLNYNRKELERMTENDKHDKNKDRVFCLERSR